MSLGKRCDFFGCVGELRCSTFSYGVITRLVMPTRWMPAGGMLTLRASSAIPIVEECNT